MDQVQQLGLGGGVELLDVFQDDDGLAGALVLGGCLAEGNLDVDAAGVATMGGIGTAGSWALSVPGRWPLYWAK